MDKGWPLSMKATQGDSAVSISKYMKLILLHGYNLYSSYLCKLYILYFILIIYIIFYFIFNSVQIGFCMQVESCSDGLRMSLQVQCNPTSWLEYNATLTTEVF